MPFSLVTEDVLKEKDKMLAHFRESGSYSYPPLKEYRSENLLKERKGLMFAILIAETKGVVINPFGVNVQLQVTKKRPAGDA